MTTTATNQSTRTLTLEERVQLLEDEREILRTMNQYTRSMDYGKDPAEFSDCFTEGGVWRSSVAGPWAGSIGVRLAGKSELEAWYMKPGRADPDWPAKRKMIVKHGYLEPQIHIRGDHATLDAYMMVPRDGQQGPFFHSIGRYVGMLVRCADGKWRFEDLEVQREGGEQAAQDRPVG
jgi:hypothetical protein